METVAIVELWEGMVEALVPNGAVSNELGSDCATLENMLGDEDSAGWVYPRV